MKVKHVFIVRLLHTDGERVGGVECEGHQLAGARGARVSADHARVYPEFEVPALPPVELDGVIRTRLGPLHHRDPLLVVAEEREIEVRGARVGLGADGQVGEDSLPGLVQAPVLGTDDGLLEPLLQETGVDVVGGTGDHVGVEELVVVQVVVEVGVPKEVDELVVYLVQLFGGVLKHPEDLSRLHVVHYEVGGLGVGLGGPERDHVLAGVSQEDVVLVQQLHLPHPQALDLVKELVELPQLVDVLPLLADLHCSPVEENQDPVLEHVDRLLPVLPVNVLAGQHHLLVSCQGVRQQELVVLIEQPADLKDGGELPVAHFVDVDGLMLHGQHSQDVFVHVEALVMAQVDLVGVEGDLIDQEPLRDFDTVQGVMLEGAPGVRRHGLVVPHQLVDGRVVLLAQHLGRPHHHEVTVLGEQTALPVELLGALGRQGHAVLQGEESVERGTGDPGPGDVCVGGVVLGG